MLITVIIPHKNSIDLLHRCIESIPVSDDIEIIVVDDHSDLPKSVWEQFREKYKYVELILTNEGRGAGYARNVGLCRARGEWLVFADADDYFYPDAFKVIKNYILVHYDKDLFFFCSDSRDGVTGDIISDRVPRIRKAIKMNDINTLRFKSYVPWGKVVRRNLIDKYSIKFEEVEASNDVMFATLVGYYAEKVGLIDECLYCCTRNKDSLVFKQTPQRIKTRLDVSIRVNKFLHEKSLEKYYYDNTRLTFSFFPKSPNLFIKYLFKCWYVNNTFLYIKNVGRRIILNLRRYEN